jgi:hypothetical protein
MKIVGISKIRKSDIIWRRIFAEMYKSHWNGTCTVEEYMHVQS